MPILEVCGFRFPQFSGSGNHIFQQISTKSHIQIKFSMPTLYSMVNETRNRNRILEMCKFQFRFRLVHCGIITTVLCCGFSPNFACYSEVVSSTRVVFVRNWNWISDFRGVQIHTLAVFRLWSTRFSTIGAIFRFK